MDISADSELFEYSSKNEGLDGFPYTMEAGKSTMNTPEDINKDLMDISFSSTDTFSPKSEFNMKYLSPIEISNWEPCLIEDKLVISGTVAGSVQADRICKHRISSLIFKDQDDVTCCLLGPMKEKNDVPERLKNHFKYIYKIENNGKIFYKQGIPENWPKICTVWKLYNDSVNKESFAWFLHFENSLYNKPLYETNNLKYPNGTNTPKTKIKKKYEKYKNMFRLEMLRESIITDSENGPDLKISKKNKDITNKNNNQIVDPTTILNKRTTCYINNQIPSADRDLESDYMEHLLLSEDNDKNKSTNVTVLSPTKPMRKKNNANINHIKQNNKKIVESNKIFKELINNDKTIISESNESSCLEFNENIIANSTAISTRISAKISPSKMVHYICSKTLEGFSNTTPKINSNTSTTEPLDVVDIDIFSETVLNPPNLSINTPKEPEKNSDGSNITTTNNESPKIIDKETPKNSNLQKKSIKSNLETKEINVPYKLRSPKRYIATIPVKTRKGLKRKKQIVDDDNDAAKKSSSISNDSSNSTRSSLRKRKQLNYKELLFNPIKLKISETSSIIIDPKLQRDISPLHVIKKTKAQLKKDEKLFKKCAVVLMRENLELKLKNRGVISTTKFTVTNTNVEKENVCLTTQQNADDQHVFKSPLPSIVKTNNNLSKTLGLPKIKKDATSKKLSLPANPLEMWKLIKSKTKQKQDDCMPPSPFSILSDMSSDTSDKKRRKLFSPDNWMQSDGCLKNLSQNQYQSNDRFSLRFDDTDQNIDSEF